MKYVRYIAILISVLFASASLAQETQPATAPATQATTAPTGETLTVKVAEVRGLVRVRNSPDAPWQKCTVGMEVGEGAEFQTGPKSVCVCTIEDNQTIVLDRLGVVSVAEAVKREGTTKTDLLMKYGRTEYEIEAAGAKHDATIRSPSSTLAVRGTRVDLYDQPPFVPSAQSYTGRAIYQYAKRQTALGGPGRGAIVRSDRGSAAESALGETVIDPSIAEARTAADAKLIETEVSQGALAEFNERTGITVVKGGAGPPSDEQLASLLPGRLNIVTRWTGNADLNLVVNNTFAPGDPDSILNALTQKFGVNGAFDEILFPGFGLNSSLSGGRIDFDHRGGPNGGFEIASWANPPTGVYGIGVLPGSNIANVKVEAFLNGERIHLVFPFLDEQGNLTEGPDGQLDEITRVVERPSVPGQLTLAGFTFVPPLEELFPELVPPEDVGASAQAQRAAQRAAVRAERENRASEKKQQALARREQRRLAKETARAQKMARREGTPDYAGQIGPRPVAPKK